MGDISHSDYHKPPYIGTCSYAHTYACTTHIHTHKGWNIRCVDNTQYNKLSGTSGSQVKASKKTKGIADGGYLGIGTTRQVFAPGEDSSG